MGIEKQVQVPTPSSIINAIHIAIDTYDEIFSDFDPSPYSERVLSSDFLREMKKRGIEKSTGIIEVRFTLPEGLRDQKIESLIKKRLRGYFAKKSEEEGKRTAGEYKHAAKKIVVGVTLLLFELIIEYHNITELWVRLLSVPMIPAGWYLLYSSFETIFDHQKIHVRKMEYLKRMSKGTFHFVSQEEVVKALSEPQEQKPSTPATTNKNTS